MKTDDLMKICGELHSILKSFPGMELTSALVHVKQAVAEYQERRAKIAPKQQPVASPPPTIDLQSLTAMSSMQLLHHLQTAKQFKLKKDLQALAQQLGLSYTQSQTKDALMHMIVKSFQLQRMDAMIQTEHTHHEKTSQPTG